MDQALYEETYSDIARQLFPRGVPQWATDAGRSRSHYGIAVATLCAMRDMGRFDGDPLVEARKAPLPTGK